MVYFLGCWKSVVSSYARGCRRGSASLAELASAIVLKFAVRGRQATQLNKSPIAINPPLADAANVTMVHIHQGNATTNGVPIVLLVPVGESLTVSAAGWVAALGGGWNWRRCCQCHPRCCRVLLLLLAFSVERTHESLVKAVP
jgi:hypothetical protein